MKPNPESSSSPLLGEQTTSLEEKARYGDSHDGKEADPATVEAVLQKEYEELVIAKIRRRRDAGRAKYGTTLARTDLSTVAWIDHAQEEALDFALYLERLRDEITNHHDFMAFMAGTLADWPCCHEEGAHDGTPPMMWPELIACIVKRAVTDSKKGETVQ